jgi:hypothetical protein
MKSYCFQARSHRHTSLVGSHYFTGKAPASFHLISEIAPNGMIIGNGGNNTDHRGLQPTIAGGLPGMIVELQDMSGVYFMDIASHST